MKKMIFLTVVFASLFVTSQAFAQGGTPALSEEAPDMAKEVPVEVSTDTGRKPGEWERSVNLGFNLTEGNSNTTLFTAGFLAEMEENQNIWRFKGNHSFGDNENATTGETETNIDQSDVVSEYKRLITDRLYYGLGANYTRDDIADLKYRVWANPAVGYFFFKDADVRLNVEAGPSYVFEEQGGIRNDYLAPRVGERFEYVISPTAKFFEEIYVTFDASDSNNTIIEGRAGIETTVTETLSLVIAVEDVYDDLPAAGRKRNDLITFTTLKYAF